MSACEPHPGDAPTTPRWLHGWAVLTACATFVLLLLGSLVTTKKVGMADPVWPTTPWFLLFFNWQEPRPGFIIEHSHRAAGYLVGCCAIVLAVGCWRGEPRRWLRLLGYAILLGVIVQGLLGGFRVVLDRWLGPNLALVHGMFAQVVFGLMVTMACCTSRRWATGRLSSDDPADIRRLRRLAILTVALVYVQIVFGAVLRHTYSPLGPRGHFLGAFAVTAAAVWLVKEIWERHAADRALTRPAAALAAAVAVQLMLGVETWLTRYVAASPTHQILLRTAHVLTGSLVLAAAVAVAAQAQRPAVTGERGHVSAPSAPVGTLQEVA